MILNVNTHLSCFVISTTSVHLQTKLNVVPVMCGYRIPLVRLSHYRGNQKWLPFKGRSPKRFGDTRTQFRFPAKKGVMFRQNFLRWKKMACAHTKALSLKQTLLSCFVGHTKAANNYFNKGICARISCCVLPIRRCLLTGKLVLRLTLFHDRTK